MGNQGGKGVGKSWVCSNKLLLQATHTRALPPTRFMCTNKSSNTMRGSRRQRGATAEM